LKQYRISLLLFLLLFINGVYSKDITFNHLTTEEGLSQFSVNSIYEDELGYIWIGTREGLNRLSGNKSIKTFKFIKNDPNSLFSNTILRVVGNKKGKIYLLCTDGVSEYDIKTEKFTTLLQGEISAIHYRKRLYMSKRNEIYYYNNQSKSFNLYYTIANSNIKITSLFLDNKNILWIGTENSGVYKLNGNRQISHPILKGNITNIYCDSSNDLWIGSWENGLFHISKKGIVNITNNPLSTNTISSNFVRTCCEDNLGNLWIGTFNGLNKFDKKSGKFSYYTVTNKPGSLTNQSIWCLIKDQQGTIWVGTYFGGVNYFNPEYEIYTKYTDTDSEKTGLSSPIVGKIVEDKNQNLWICTEGGGLNFYDRRNHTFKWYKANGGKNSISHNNLKSIYYNGKEDILWIGTHLGGLNKLDIKKNTFTQYRSNANDPTSLPSDIVKDIIPYRNELVIGTHNGVCLFNPQNGKARKLFTNINEGKNIKLVSDLFIDHTETLWIAVPGEGVFSYNFKTNKLTNYQHNPSVPNSISSNNVNSILEDHHHNLWFATSGCGLDLFNYSTRSFENFDSQKNGLMSDCIYYLWESLLNKLLVITNQGFSVFDYNTKRFSNYSKEKGFPLTAINENALYQARDGEIFIGGVNGMISFYENDLNFKSKPYNILFNRLIVNNKEIQVNDETGILENSLSCSQEISLKYGQTFNIEIATTNFIDSNKGEIEYKLEGFSDKWINTQGNNIITYTNLNPGEYTLVVRVCSGNKVIGHEAKLNIEIRPPFYRTIYAYLFYLIVIGVITYYLNKIYKERIKLQESLKYEQKHIQDVEKLNQSKLRFFTDISHEFRTPLTLITGQVEMLLQYQSFTPAIYNKVLGIYKSSMQLKELITELLDFRKQEQGHMKIKVSYMNFVEFLNENYLIFQEYARAKQINLVFDKKVDKLDVWFNQKHMQKVVNNLLSNAFKHTEAEGTISISVKQENDNAILEIKDSGRGIEAKELDKVFDSFYQTEVSESVSDYVGTGIGLALTKSIIDSHHGTIKVSSEVNIGTSFIISLKLGNEHFSQEQLVIKDEQQEFPETIQPESGLIFEQVALEESKKDRIRNSKILIVEDNEGLRNMLVNIFETFYEVISAADGEEGLMKARDEKPNIILSDVMMPKMSGTELCKQIKADFDTCHIPVVLLTARTAIEHNLEGLRIGADDYITKPFNVNILVSRCNNLVNGRLLLQEKFSKQPQAYAQILATNPIDKDLIDKAMTIIENHLDDTEFNVNIFAREIGIARTSLFSKIKAITGQTPNDFILTVRLKKGALLLRNNPELNISEIADKIGFASSRYFSKCFKDVYHVSPLLYRKGESGEDEESISSGDE
jgi:Signal transduction histidine kinase